MPRRVPVELQLLAAEYLAEARRVEAATKAMDREMDQLDRSIDAVDRDMAELAASAELAKREVDALGDEARGTAADLKAMEASAKASGHVAGGSFTAAAEEAKKFSVEIDAAKKRLRGLEQELLTTNDAAGLRRRIRQERSWISDLTRAAADLGQVGAKAGADAAREVEGGMFAALDGMGPQIKVAVISALVPAIGAAAPVLGAMLGGLMTGAVGTAGLALGIASSTKDPRVIAAAKSAGTSIMNHFFEGGAAFAQPVIDGIGIIEDAFDSLNLGDALATVAPEVEIIAKGIAGLMTEFMPGFLDALEHSEPFAEAAAAGMADFGKSLGMMLSLMSSSPGAVSGLTAAFKIVNGVLVLVGANVKVLSAIFQLFNFSMFAFAHAAEFVSRALGSEGLAGVFHELGHPFFSIVEHSGKLGGQLIRVGEGAGSANSKLDPFAKYLQEAEEHTRGLTDSLKDLFGIQMSVDEATISYEKSIDELTKSIQENGTSIDARTEKGRNNRSAILDEVSAAMALRDANVKAGMSAADANKIYQDQIRALEQAAIKAGVNKAALMALVGQYEVTVTYNIRTKGKPPSFIDANLSEPARDAAHRAAGGPVGPGLTLVGEEGPEYLSLRNGQYGQVYNNTQTRQMQQYNGVDGGTTTVRHEHVVDLQIGGRTVRKLLIDDALNRGVLSSVASAAFP